MKTLNTIRATATIGFAVLSLSACGSDGGTAPATNSATPSYSVVATGDRSGSRSGAPLTQLLVNGWKEVSNGGATTFVSDVTLLTFAGLDATLPQTSIGLLGSAKVGAYRVRVGGAPFGANSEFYGDYRVVNPDGTSTDYTATSGSVSITAIAPVIRGSFSFHASRSTTWPAVIAVGTTVNSLPASLDVTGSFVANLP